MAISVWFGGTPGSHSRNPEVPRNPGWKTLVPNEAHYIALLQKIKGEAQKGQRPNSN